MPWLKVDDKFMDHPKVLAVGNSAFRLHMTAMCYAAQYLTDGFIANSILRRLSWACDNVDDDIKELIDNELWEQVDGGYAINMSMFKIITGSAMRNAWDAIRRFISPRIIQRDGAVCAECGTTEDITIDHIIPISKGGSNNGDNLRVLCRSCNARKGNRL